MTVKHKLEVKICGVRNSQEAQKVIDLGADYIGILVDFPKTRISLNIEEAKLIVGNLRKTKFIILTIKDNVEDLIRLINEIKPWGVQLLRPSPKIVKKLKKSTKVKIIPVIHIVDQDSIKNAEKYYNADFLLLDSKKGHFLGGTGKVHDWSISKKIIEKSQIPVFLAGGLNSSNIKNAVDFLKPYAVDAESSLQDKRGFRDLRKVRRFIVRAKNL